MAMVDVFAWASTPKRSAKKADPHYKTKAHMAWREQVLARAAFRCEHVSIKEERCRKAGPYYRMFADHIVERKDGGAAFDVENGQCLCGAHHTRKTIAARNGR